MKKQLLLLAAAGCLYFQSCQTTTSEKSQPQNIDTAAIVANYLIKSGMADSILAFDSKITKENKPLGILDCFYFPSTAEYNSPRMHRTDAIGMIERYQDTRKAEVGSFLIKADNLLSFLNELKNEGATDIQFILAQQPEVDGKIDDMTIVVTGVAYDGQKWIHKFGMLGGTQDAVLQHVKPLKLTDEPGTAL